MKTLNSIKLGHLHAFVTVAEEENFGKAAVALNITQPALSRLIQSLEKVVEVELFSREGRSVVLTQAGRSFLENVREILSQTSAAISAAQRLSSKELPSFTIGFIGHATHTALPALVSQIKNRSPIAKLVFREMLTAEQIQALLSGRIDIGIGRMMQPVTGISHASILRENLVLAVMAGDDLNDIERMTIDDISTRPFIMYEPSPSGYIYRIISDAFERTGFRPNIVQHVTLTQTILSLVGAGVGVAIVPESARHHSPSGVRFIDLSIPGDPFVETHLLWRQDSDSTVLPKVLNCAGNCFPLFVR